MTVGSPGIGTVSPPVVPAPAWQPLELTAFPASPMTMPRYTNDSPLRIRLSPERRTYLIDELKEYFDENFDDPLSTFRAEGLLDFVVGALGPPIYNQGVRDACAAMQEKLLDLEGEVFERVQGGPPDG